MADRIQLRRDTAANWTSTNPTLAQGEAGYETDTGKLKIGDGSTAWTSLDYFLLESSDFAELLEGGSPVVVQSDIGTAPNQVPLNQYLGDMAYQSHESVVVEEFTSNGIDDNATSTALTLDSSQNATFAGDVTLNGGDLTISGSTPGIYLDETDANSRTFLVQDGDAFQIQLREGTTYKYSPLTIGYNPTTEIINSIICKTGAGTTALTLDSSQNATFAGLVTTNGQVKFPATQNASSDANTLDDYEEGTWTPVLSDGSNNATASQALGRYTKVGRTVQFEVAITTTSLGSVTGSIHISGLPFTSNSAISTPVIVLGASGLNITAGYALVGVVPVTQTKIDLYLVDSATGATAMQSTEWSDDGSARISGTYSV